MNRGKFKSSARNNLIGSGHRKPGSVNDALSDSSVGKSGRHCGFQEEGKTNQVMHDEGS